MKKAFLFLFVAATIYACGGSTAEGSGSSGSASSSGPSSDAAAEPQVAAVDGEKVYRQYCVACHGVYGDMGAAGAYNLTTSELSIEERVQVITKGRVGANGGAMQAFEALLKPEEIEAVAEYTLTLKQDG